MTLRWSLEGIAVGNLTGTADANESRVVGAPDLIAGIASSALFLAPSPVAGEGWGEGFGRTFKSLSDQTIFPHPALSLKIQRS